MPNLPIGQAFPSDPFSVRVRGFAPNVLIVPSNMLQCDAKADQYFRSLGNRLERTSHLGRKTPPSVRENDGPDSEVQWGDRHRGQGDPARVDFKHSSVRCTTLCMRDSFLGTSCTDLSRSCDGPSRTAPSRSMAPSFFVPSGISLWSVGCEAGVFIYHRDHSKAPLVVAGAVA
ncbi:hypothetical protein OG21DRAFT_1313335 [Imleria badia]|nr:hypothetical protein OG21DRAFT_1313335 [Imleria badia]